MAESDTGHQPMSWKTQGDFAGGARDRDRPPLTEDGVRRLIRKEVAAAVTAALAQPSRTQGMLRSGARVLFVLALV